MLSAAACGGQSGQGHSSPSPTGANATASPTQQPTPTPPVHIFLIVMENRSYSQAIAGSYTAQLAAKYGVATRYRGITHPSLPNYLAMTSGSTWGVTDDGFHSLPAGGLGTQMTNAGIVWRAYMEGMGADCLSNGNGYALKHDPFPYYGSACPPQVVPFTQFATDMQGDTPQFVWITPNQCHSGHDCSTATADAWLADIVPTILATGAWQTDGVLFITWDEGEDSVNSVLTLVIRPTMVNHTSDRPYNHYSLLATIEYQFGLGYLGAAKDASAMSDLMATR